jgi:hypothetical protein
MGRNAQFPSAELVPELAARQLSTSMGVQAPAQSCAAEQDPEDAAARLSAAEARLGDARAEARRLEAARQALEEQARPHS